LVCGSNLLFSPESTAGLSNLNFLSPDGKCYSFDERANGYARGEGIVSLVIKPLSTAIQDGDTIRALIRGTGVNSDGRTPGITQPSSEAQVALIRETYRRFGLDPSLTRYFEAHGTGTAIGDPLEAKAIATVFKQRQRGRDSPMFVGALKSNIGHLEGASGLAGVIKAILVLENALIPPNIWLHRVNSAIKEEWGLIFPTKAVPFPGEGLRRASVNSFGFGGTNAHAVLDDTESFLKEQNFKESVQPRSRVSAGGNTSVQASKLLVWSAADEMGVKRLREAYSSHFLSRVCSEGEDIDAEYLGDLAYTLSRRRTHLPWRSFSICDSPKNLCNLDFAAATRMNSRLRVCYVFTGQGAQWTTMGQDLLSYDVFRQSIENSDATLRDMGCQFSIIGMLLNLFLSST
jgi:acyl transferase domain-containing protein